MLLSFRQVTKHFPVARGLLGRPTAFVKAVDDVSFGLEEGEVLGIVGESGCGKSTLGRCAVGLCRPTGGGVEWNGQDPSRMSRPALQKARRQFQMVFQNPFASLNPRQKVKDALLEPLEVHGLLRPSERPAFVEDLLNQVGLGTGDLCKYPHEFSGGQRQRIGLARALACQPGLMVLDEPVSSLDVSVQASILNLLARLNRDQRIAYVFISHDLQVVGYLSRRILVMYLGQVVEEGETAQVLARPRHPYTQALLKASEGGRVKIQGEPPSPVHAPQGCSFHPRCPYAEERCRCEKQKLEITEGEGRVACWKWDRL